jgi:hypothetical protein
VSSLIIVAQGLNAARIGRRFFQTGGGLPINSSVKGKATRRSKRVEEIKSGSEVVASEPLFCLFFNIGTAFQTHAQVWGAVVSGERDEQDRLLDVLEFRS